MDINYYKYLKYINPLLKVLGIKMPAYYWGLYPCNDDEIKSNIGLFNEIISKNSTNKTTFKDLKKLYLKQTKEKHKETIEFLEKEYPKDLNKLDDDFVNEKINYLKDIFQLEKGRQSSIDNKFTQIIGQSSIVIAVVSIIIPLVNDKFSYSSEYLLLIILIAFLGVFSIYNLTSSIWISIKHLKTRGYSRPMHNQILYHSKSKLRDFKIDHLINLYNSTNDNIDVNSIKADKVNKAYSRFSRGIVFFLFTSILVTTYIFKNPKEDVKKVTIANQLNVKEIEVQLNSISKKLSDLNSNEIQTIDKLNNGLKDISEELQCLTKNIVHLADSAKSKDESNK